MRSFLVIIACLLVAGPTRADNRSFDVDHLQLALTRSPFFATESAAEVPRWDYRAGVAYRYLQSPLVLERPGERREVIRDRSTVEVQGAVQFGRWVGIGVALPIVVAERGSLDVSHAAAIGDVRLVPRVDLVHRGGFGLVLTLGLRLPSGARDRFVGEGMVVFEPRIALAAKLGIVDLGANIGFRVRAARSYLDLDVGNEVSLHLAAAITPKRYISLVLEAHGDTAMSKQFARTASSPLEVLVGVFGMWRGFRVGAAAGAGVVEGFGSPRVRALALVEYRRPIVVPPPPAPAPTPPRPPAPPVITPEPEPEDEEPVEEEPEEVEPEPEITMTEPAVAIHKGRIELAEPVFFKKDRQRIRSRFYDELNQLARVLNKRTDLLVMIEGHADATGPERWNLELSRRRAAAVARFLIEHGVAKERLRPVGYGEARPLIATPDGEENERNRRVHFFTESESELPEASESESNAMVAGNRGETKP